MGEIEKTPARSRSEKIPSSISCKTSVRDTSVVIGIVSVLVRAAGQQGSCRVRPRGCGCSGVWEAASKRVSKGAAFKHEHQEKDM